MLAAVLLSAAALHELAAARGEFAADAGRRLARRISASPAGRALAAVAGPRVEARIRAAGLGGRLGARDVALTRAAAALIALPAAVALAPAAPGRTGVLVALGLPLAAALSPDLALERLIKRRRAALAAALPASLELMAVRAASGGGPLTLLGDARAALGDGPLRGELAAAWAEVRCGVPQSRSLERLGTEGGPELAALAVAIERSRRLGAPLADNLQRQAAALREEQGRSLAESAARAAPKIQLVVALMLVPSVLLLVAAAIAANAEALLSGLG